MDEMLSSEPPPFVMLMIVAGLVEPALIVPKSIDVLSSCNVGPLTTAVPSPVSGTDTLAVGAFEETSSVAEAAPADLGVNVTVKVTLAAG